MCDAYSLLIGGLKVPLLCRLMTNYYFKPLILFYSLLLRQQASALLWWSGRLCGSGGLNEVHDTAVCWETAPAGEIRWGGRGTREEGERMESFLFFFFAQRESLRHGNPGSLLSLSRPQQISWLHKPIAWCSLQPPAWCKAKDVLKHFNWKKLAFVTLATEL